jgi:hypothetical protein
MTRRPLAAPSAVLLVVLLLAAGCGGQGSDETATDAAAEPTSSSASPSESPDESPSSSEESPAPPPTPPRCDRVWVAEAPLAWDYRGCLRDGRLVKADKETCTNGQQLVRFDGRFYGAVGGKVLDEGDLATSERFQKALRACHG